MIKLTEEFIRELIEPINENECIELKENWFDKDGIGEYISAISNAAAVHGEDFGYMIWGVEDTTHKIVGTNFNPNKEIKNEPLKHYLARNLNPSIAFKFEEYKIEDKRLVILIIPAARSIITEFNKERYIRIGSSKEHLRKYPEREADLWIILRQGMPTIINTKSPSQVLEFNALLSFYIDRGLPLNIESYKDNLNLYVPNTKDYNLMAYILSDYNQITCRVSVFNGESKSGDMFALNDYGYKSILITINQIINYLESFNLTLVDESNRIIERKDISLFDSDCLREIILNAFIHNDWLELNAPMISVYTDRIEILSYGSLPAKQTITGFLSGKSNPRCQELANIFLQLRISERSGKGVPQVVNTYGKDVFQIEEDFIKVTIPFVTKRTFTSIYQDDVNSTSKSEKAKNKILSIIKDNPNIKLNELIETTKLSRTSVQKYIRILINEGCIRRVGSNRNGYYEVIIQRDGNK